jgi:2-haloacid dehalogenase
MKIHTLIFDLGGVLVDWNPAYLFRKIFDDPAEIHYFLTKVCTPEWNAEQDAGRPIATATEMLINQFPDYANPIRAYYDRWTEMVAGPIQDTVHVLDTIKSRGEHRLLALTNWSHETFPYALETFPFLSHFEGILVSGLEGLKKPDPAIFQLMIQRYQLNNLDGVLFIDDNAENIDTAKALGFQVIHFQRTDQLKSKLLDFGIRS